MATASFVYIVSSSREDHVAEMAAVSMVSLRITNPDSSIIALVDKASQPSPGLSAIHGVADLVIEECTPFDRGVEGSRYLKVNVRRFLSGDFFYLDGDTVVLRPLSWKTDADIAAARDLNDRGQAYITTNTLREIYGELGWNLSGSPYINCGVVLVKDNATTCAFYESLAANWDALRRAVKKPNDQPAFNYTLRSSDVRFELLPSAYNAQITMNPLTAQRASIVHVFSGDFDVRNDTVLHIAAKKLKAEGKLDNNLLRQSIRRGHVWTVLDTPKKNYAAGHYVTAVKALLGKHLRG